MRSMSSSPVTKRRPTNVAPPPPVNASPDGDDEADDDASQRFMLFNVVPSWMVSLVTHVLLVVMLALFIMPSHEEKTVSFDAADVAGDQLDAPSIDFSEMDLDSSTLEDSEFTDTEAMKLIDPTETPMLDLTPTTSLSDLLASPLESVTGQSEGALASTATSGATSGRTGEQRERMLKKYGGTPESENAVMLALEWLVKHQLADGSWSFDHTIGPGPRSMKDPGELRLAQCGATGLALLCFLGNGQTHKQGQYKDVVRRGLEFLLSHGTPTPNGLSFSEAGGTMYSHGICAIVLCESFAMTDDPSLRQPAQEAVRYIEYCQHRLGGWRYEPHQPGDTSVVGWQLMALKSAVNSGLQVNPNTFKMAERFLDSVSTQYGAFYGYLEPPEELTRAFRGRTAVGILSRMYLGWDRDRQGVIDGVRWMSDLGPAPDTARDKAENSCNMYYNYYATQVMMQYGGPPWEKWNKVMRDFLVETQDQTGQEKGSWYWPRGEMGAEKGGRLYCTCLATLTLEVYYRYLPLYDKKSFEEAFPLD